MCANTLQIYANLAQFVVIKFAQICLAGQNPKCPALIVRGQTKQIGLIAVKRQSSYSYTFCFLHCTVGVMRCSGIFVEKYFLSIDQTSSAQVVCVRVCSVIVSLRVFYCILILIRNRNSDLLYEMASMASFILTSIHCFFHNFQDEEKLYYYYYYLL